MTKAKSCLLVLISISSILAFQFPITWVNGSSSPPNMITNTGSSTATLPESTQRIFQNSRGTMANYVFYSTSGSTGTCNYAYSVDSVAWIKDQSTTLGTSFPICSVTYREDPPNNRTLVYIVGSHVSDSIVGGSHNILFNIGTIADASSTISWISTTPQTLFNVTSAQATEYPVIIIDAKGYLLVAFSFVNKASSHNKAAENVLVCGSSTRLPTSSPSWTCSSTSNSCTVGTNCPFAASNEVNIVDAKYMPQLVPNVSGSDALVIRGQCEGSEALTCHAQPGMTQEASNTVMWTGTNLSFGSVPATFNLESPAQDPADQRSASILVNYGYVYLAYANGTSQPLGGSQVIWRALLPPYTSWGSAVGYSTGIPNKSLHMTIDQDRIAVYLVYTNCCAQSNSRIGILDINQPNLASTFYANATIASYWASSPMTFNNQTNAKNILLSFPLAWVNQASTPELWFGLNPIAQVSSTTLTGGTPTGIGEVTIDANPSNLRNLAAVFYGHFQYYAGGQYNFCTMPDSSKAYCMTEYTLDDGKSWHLGNASVSLWYVFTNGFSFADPTLTFDSSGNVYFIAGAEALDASLGVVKSTDGGQTFTSISRAFTNTTYTIDDTGQTVHPCSPQGLDFWKITADKSSSSPFKNNVYALTKISLNMGTQGCQTKNAFERSIDGGNTWISAQSWNSTGVFGDYNNDPMTVAPNGNLYIAEQASGSQPICPGPAAGIVVLKSTNGGQTFSPTCAFRGSFSPGINPQLPEIVVAPDNAVYCVFVGLIGINVYHLYSIMSNDNGATWTQPVRVDDVLPNDTVQQPGQGNLGLGMFAVSSSTTGRVEVSWFDYRNAPSGNLTIADIYTAFTMQPGNPNFSMNIRLTVNGPFYHCPTASANGQSSCYTPGNDYFGMASVGQQSFTTASMSTNEGFSGGQAVQYVLEAAYT